MRKYYQAALAIIAVVSLVSFLFYRHEYNKLHYVLEVFNYFGDTHTKDLPNCTNIIKKSSHIISEPLPSWLRVNENLFLYSSHNLDNKQVRTIAFGKIESNLRCAIYVNDNKSTPLYGTVHFYPIKESQDESLQGYYLNCNSDNSKTPVGVQYFSEFENVGDVPLMAVKSSPKDLKGHDCAMCILPLEQLLTVDEKISFITVQNVVGFQYFLVYDFGLDGFFNAEMRKNVKSTYNYETVPWNFPFRKIKRDIVRSLVQADCFLRTRNIAKYATMVQWGEYLMPKYHETIEHLMFDLQRNRIVSNCYSVGVVGFCRGDHSNESKLGVFKMTIVSPTKYVERVLICAPHKIVEDKNETIAVTSQNLIKVHRYDYCPVEVEKNKRTVVDESMLGFEKIVMQEIANFHEKDN